MPKAYTNLCRVAALAAVILLAASSCKKREAESGAGPGEKSTLQVQGSDTMVNLAQAWAEAYQKVDSKLSVEVGGGGSGVGISALLNGTLDIANSSRDMKPEEKTKAKNSSGKEAKEFMVGYDALAVYVHKDNPITEITLEQLAGIFAEGGKTIKWPDLGATVPGCASGEIIRVSRQSNSGTYEFFREHVLSKKDFKLGSRDMNGSKEVVELVSHTPCAIGYSGMGYATAQVKMLKVAQKTGETAYPPNLENAQNKKYPIARPLYLYTLGDPQGAARRYIIWILSDAGQKIVEQSGYVPVPSAQRATLK